MNRRDTIIVSVLLNAAIIAVLLIMAVNTEEEVIYDRPPAETNKNSPQLTNTEGKQESSLTQSTSKNMMVELDEVGFDTLTNDFASSLDDFFLVDEDVVPEKPVKPAISQKEESVPSDMEGVKVVDIVVKKGDSLDKIARANGTTIEAIKNLNKLKTVNLSIGQKLRVPVGYKKANNNPPAKENKPQAAVKTETKPQPSATAEYYTIKSGDSPWKIAKEQHVSMDDILRLNQLNEERAKNLKIGDRIRIR